MKKKILFIGSNPREAGGIETFGRNLQKIFEDEIDFYSVTEKNPIYDVKNVYIGFKYNYLNRVINKITLERISYYKINKLIKKNNYTYVILNTPQDFKFLSKENIEKLKIILVQHQTFERYYISKVFIDKNKKYVDIIRNKITTFVALSPEDRLEFITKLKLDSKKVVYIRHMSEIPLLEMAKINSGKKLISICRIDNDHKRIDLMIDGIKEMKDYTLEIYGDGKDRSRLVEYIEKEKISNVKFKGIITNIQDKLDENSIFIMTSDYEGYPVAVIESIRRGLPIIVRNTYTAVKDLVKKNGVLLSKEWNKEEFREAILKIENDYQDYSNEAIKEGKKYDFDLIKKEWKLLIDGEE